VARSVEGYQRRGGCQAWPSGVEQIVLHFQGACFTLRR
jgi:hypothetical protein